MKASRYWFQIRLMTDPVRGYFVNVGVAIFDVATSELHAQLAPWAPLSAHSTVRRIHEAVMATRDGLAAAIEDPASGGEDCVAAALSPYHALVDAIGHCGERIKCGPLLGMTTREPVEKLLATTYQLMVA